MGVRRRKEGGTGRSDSFVDHLRNLIFALREVGRQRVERVLKMEGMEYIGFKRALWLLS